MTPDAAAKLLNRLHRELVSRQPEIEELDDAYRGERRLRFASDHFRDFIENRYKGFNDNWCGIVADAPHERLEVTGIRLGDDDRDGDRELWDDWRRTDSDAYSDLAFLDAINCKRAFALVWGDPKTDDPIVTWEHPSQAIVAYDPETRQRKAGAKVWADDDFEYATLYLPDELWKFQRPRVSTKSLILPLSVLTGGWALREPEAISNPLGKVPLVEFTNRSRLKGEPLSDISGALAMQDAINMLWAETFAVADEATIGQRLILGAEPPTIPVLDDDGNIVGEKPIDLKKWRRDRVSFVTDPTAKAYEWTAAQLEPFTDVIEIAVGHIAAQTRTPAHYLLIGGTMANVSADAMKALETGLVQRTREKTQHFGRSVRDVFELIALARGDKAKAQAVRSGTALWRDVENRTDAELSDAAKKDREIGLPLRFILERRYNLAPTEIDRVMEMVEQENADPVMSRIAANALGARERANKEVMAGAGAADPAAGFSE